MRTDTSSGSSVVTAARPRTSSGLWRAQNMIRSAPMKGDHVMIESTGIPFMSAWPLDPDDQEEQAERDPVHVVLRLPGLDAAQAIARLEGPRAEEVDHAVHDVAVDPSH